jgi:hypothetical protein
MVTLKTADGIPLNLVPDCDYRVYVYDEIERCIKSGLVDTIVTTFDDNANPYSTLVLYGVSGTWFPNQCYVDRDKLVAMLRTERKGELRCQ